ncbi:hypothetical protein SAMN04488131_12032 [Flavobacterium xueshanense]|uniref:Uncharacterized protein n=1 Tax=Flavobacterium xueshanense TaxID=935223 RepID=A0A1I2IJX6_9FLAO|nr:hypothetical protein SAMN04488131_12032 [Flavobacterium xueshanense]
MAAEIRTPYYKVAREDGGVPKLLQVQKTAFSTQMKEKMGIENIVNRDRKRGFKRKKKSHSITVIVYTM